MRGKTLKTLWSTLLMIALLFTMACSSIPAQEATSGQGPQKRALLVGINDYQNVTKLGGCVNDVLRMKNLLVNKFQFPEVNIIVLTDKQATRAGMIKAFRQELIEKAKPGDIIVFHYSGHGSRMKDVHKDEIDGWDSTIVPQDSRAGDIFDLSDDEINDLLLELAQKTANITCVLDSCHSGNATRGGATVRQIPDDLRDPPVTTRTTRGTETKGASGFRPISANYVLIAGSKAHQLSNEFIVEGQRQGALTFYLTEALKKAGEQTTYRDLMDEVSRQVSARFPSQEPDLEGAGADALVFSGAQCLAQAYVLASPGQRHGEVLVEAGAVYGLSKGSILDVYLPATKTFGPETKRVAQIELTKVDPLTAEARILEGSVTEKYSRAVLREVSYADFKLKLYYAGLERSPVLRQIQDRLSGCAFIEKVSNELQCHLRLREEKGEIVTEAADTSPLSPRVSASDPGAVDHVEKQILQWHRWYAVRSISNPVPRVSVKLHFSPTPPGFGATREVREGERYELSVEKASDQPLSVAVLDLSTDGSITVVFPPEGGARQVPQRSTSAPVGLEFFVPEGRSSVQDTIKVFATDGPIDPWVFRQEAVRGPKAAGDASLNPLAALLESSLLGRTRNPRPVKLGDWATVELLLLVKKP